MHTNTVEPPETEEGKGNIIYNKLPKRVSLLLGTMAFLSGFLTDRQGYSVEYYNHSKRNKINGNSLIHVFHENLIACTQMYSYISQTLICANLP